MNLIVDIGNSRVKLALTEGGEAVAQCAGPALDRALLGGFVAGRWVRRAIVCSTRGDAAEAAELVRTFVADCLVFTPDTPVPLANAYLTPRTLGRDRLAAAVGAATLCPGRDVLIADFGTALTVDLVTADGTFRGGLRQEYNLTITGAACCAACCTRSRAICRAWLRGMPVCAYFLRAAMRNTLRNGLKTRYLQIVIWS